MDYSGGQSRHGRGEQLWQAGEIIGRHGEGAWAIRDDAFGAARPRSGPAESFFDAFANALGDR